MQHPSLVVPAMWLVAVATVSGCSTMRQTDTARTAREQMLISSAVDQSLDRVDFSGFRGQQVFFDEKYVDCTDKNYVIASIRHRLLNVGASLVPKPEEADVVLEARTGSVGTDRSDKFVGIPEINLPAPIPIAFPEIRVWSKTSQTAAAKIGLVAYDPKTKTIYGDGGTSLAQSDDNNWYLFGVGPFQNGSLRRDISKSKRTPTPPPQIPDQIAFRDQPRPVSSPDEGSSRIRLTGNRDDEPVMNPNSSPVPSPEFDPFR